MHSCSHEDWLTYQKCFPLQYQFGWIKLNIETLRWRWTKERCDVSYIIVDMSTHAKLKFRYELITMRVLKVKSSMLEVSFLVLAFQSRVGGKSEINHYLKRASRSHRSPLKLRSGQKLSNIQRHIFCSFSFKTWRKKQVILATLYHNVISLFSGRKDARHKRKQQTKWSSFTWTLFTIKGSGFIINEILKFKSLGHPPLLSNKRL